MKLFQQSLLSIALVFFSANAFSADVEVKWTEPEKYRDIEEGTEHKAKYQKRIFDAFEKHFAKLASKLPPEQLLKINVTDVDLAGDVRFDTSQQIRVVKELYFPRIKFSYQLLDANKNIVIKETVNLKDMNFLMGTKLAYRNQVLSYERKMLDDWFNKTFKDFLPAK